MLLHLFTQKTGISSYERINISDKSNKSALFLIVPWIFPQQKWYYDCTQLQFNHSSPKASKIGNESRKVIPFPLCSILLVYSKMLKLAHSGYRSPAPFSPIQFPQTVALDVISMQSQTTASDTYKWWEAYPFHKFHWRLLGKGGNCIYCNSKKWNI